jgi:uncharacterized protein (DUF1778 family)
MARLTLRLPESLHEALAAKAKEEGVSMNQYLVYALSRAAAADIAEAQRTVFEGLRSRVSSEQAEAALRELLAART